MKPQTKENKKKLSTIAKRLKKDLPLTGLVSSPLAPTGCTPETSDIAPNTVGDIAPCPDNPPKKIRKTKAKRPVPAEPPVVEDRPFAGNIVPPFDEEEDQPFAGNIVPPFDEKTKKRKKTEQVRIKLPIERLPLAGVPRPPRDKKEDGILANLAQSLSPQKTTIPKEKK